MATVVIGLIVLAIAVLAGKSVLHEFKSGSGASCGGKCEHCADAKGTPNK